MSRACKTKFLIDNLLNHVRNNALPVQSFLIERLEFLTGFPQFRQHQYIKRASLSKAKGGPLYIREVT
jgi:hypothetical protein